MAKQLVAGGPAACPKASKLGKGTANALLGVNGTSPTPLHFDVTPILVGKTRIDFNLFTPAIGNLISPATIKGSKLTITVPDAAQQPLPGTYAGLAFGLHGAFAAFLLPLLWRLSGLVIGNP